MQRILIISAAIIAGLVLIMGGLYSWLFSTNSGRSFLITQIESNLSIGDGGITQIGAIEGALPGQIQLRDLVLTDRQGPWLEINNLDLEWKLLPLLQKKISITSLVIDSGTYYRPPAAIASETNEPEPFTFTLPSLPNLSAENLRIKDFQIMSAGHDKSIEATGYALMNDDQLTVRLEAATGDETDIIDVALDINPSRERLFADLTIFSNEAGLISALAGTPQGTLLKANTTQTGSLPKVDLHFNAKSLATLNGSFTATTKALNTFDIDADFSPGTDLNLGEVQGPVSLRSTFNIDDKNYNLTIDQLTTVITQSQGTLSIREKTFLTPASAEFSLQSTITAQENSLLQQFTGGRLDIEGELKSNNEDLQLTATLESLIAHLTTQDFTFDRDGNANGAVSLRVKETPQAFPVNFTNATAQTTIAMEQANTVALSGVSVQLSDGSSVTGDVGFDRTAEKIDARTTFSLAASLLQSLHPSLQTQGSWDGTVEASGTINALKASLNADSSAFTIDTFDTPPLKLVGDFSGSLQAPNLSLSAISKTEDAFVASAVVNPVQGQTLNGTIEYQRNAFSMTSNGTFDKADNIAQFSLAYTGQENAQPFPGLVLSGDINGEGEIGMGKVPTFTGTINSERLRVNDNSLSSLKIDGASSETGPTLIASLGAVGVADDIIAQDISLSASVESDKTSTIIVSSLTAIVLDQPLALNAPASFDLSDGISTNGISLSYGEMGEAELSGKFSSTLWRADTVLKDIPLPGTDFKLDGSIALDTDLPLPATGTLALSPISAETAASIVHSAMQWDGSTIALSSNDQTSLLSLNGSVPLTLSRSDTLRASMDGNVDLTILIDGELEDYLAYLSSPLQSLEGNLKGTIRIDGPLMQPNAAGEINLTDGQYTELESGLSLEGILTTLSLNYQDGAGTAMIAGAANGAGQSERETIKINGDVTFGEDTTFDLKTTFDNAVFIVHPIERLAVNGDLVIAGNMDDISATGDINIDELRAEIITPASTGLVDIEVISYNGQAPQTITPSTEAQTNLNLDININADNRIFINGRGLESEWSVATRVANPKGDPIVLGNMRLERGVLDFSGRRFDIRTGEIDFDRLEANNPTIDIEAVYETSEDITAIIAITGRATQPAISLTSTPEVPSEDVMAIILFGKPASELSAVESLQTAQALASLAGIGPFGGLGVTSKLRQATGLDLLNVDIDPETGGGSLTAGKYITDDIFISATQDATGGGGTVNVEYDVTKNISLETQLEQNGEQTVSANWKRDF